MLTTKANARAIAQANSDNDKIVRAVVRYKSKFTPMTLQSARANGFKVIEVINPSTKAGCDCREKVNAKVDGGELRERYQQLLDETGLSDAIERVLEDPDEDDDI